ncbi:hypothetical protein AMS68_001164 [Peltaster fructicola]|uniref:Uncharacterized protein n=1 Tax=Peltaster fructicola TaxID=286661 RepID=A0A6H0XLL4_9PEZI|nr:hypothetical protein AMS68_001164 [Peltaster fructicola]
MPPIPVHIESPIAPKTDTAQPVTSQPADPVITTAIPPTSTQSYPAARPGAAAVPAPTSAIPKPQPQPTRTYNPAEQAGLPPQPQPGPVPNAGAFQANVTSIPPPPTASNNAYVPPSVTTAPAQAQWSAPQQNYAPTHTTDASTPQRGPTTINLGPVVSPAAHPPGYQQDVYAQELTSQQRASLDQQEAREKQEQPFGVLSSQQGETAENVWGAVKSWGSKAGEAAAKVHGEAWKWIDGKK